MISSSLFVMIILTIVVIVSVALILGELFYFPGFGLPGIVGILGMTGTCTYLFVTGQIWLMIGLLLLSIVLFVIGFYILSRSKVMNQIALDKEVKEQVNKLPEALYIGARGTTRSRLNLAGTVEIEGKLFEATSEQGFILEGTPIFISRMTRDKVYVSMDKDALRDEGKQE